jgi:uncharacterized protein
LKFDCLDVENIIGFEWDEGNINKNLDKHGLPHSLTEEIFFNEPLLIVEDFRHSKAECRCLALGKTFEDKYLFVAFTARNSKIRVISARVMNKKERSIYESKSL